MQRDIELGKIIIQCMNESLGFIKRTPRLVDFKEEELETKFAKKLLGNARLLDYNPTSQWTKRYHEWIAYLRPYVAMLARGEVVIYDPWTDHYIENKPALLTVDEIQFLQVAQGMLIEGLDINEREKRIQVFNSQKFNNPFVLGVYLDCRKLGWGSWAGHQYSNMLASLYLAIEECLSGKILSYPPPKKDHWLSWQDVIVLANVVPGLKQHKWTPIQMSNTSDFAAIFVKAKSMNDLAQAVNGTSHSTTEICAHLLDLCKHALTVGTVTDWKIATTKTVPTAPALSIEEKAFLDDALEALLEDWSLEKREKFVQNFANDTLTHPFVTVLANNMRQKSWGNTAWAFDARTKIATLSHGIRDCLKNGTSTYPPPSKQHYLNSQELVVLRGAYTLFKQQRWFSRVTTDNDPFCQALTNADEIEDLIDMVGGRDYSLPEVFKHLQALCARALLEGPVTNWKMPAHTPTVHVSAKVSVTASKITVIPNHVTVAKEYAQTLRAQQEEAPHFKTVFVQLANSTDAKSKQLTELRHWYDLYELLELSPKTTLTAVADALEAWVAK
jgi:hypothetical protein